MDPTLLLLRWAHLLAAIVAMGGLVFARFALLPAVAELDETSRERVHDTVRRRWLPFVIGAITVLLASGLANFLLFNARVKAEGWADGEWMRMTGYHALFGVKFLLALGAFYLASGLVGRGEGTRWIRADRATWLSVALGLSLAVVMLSGWMRQLHTGPNEFSSGGVSMEDDEPSTGRRGAPLGDDEWNARLDGVPAEPAAATASGTGVEPAAAPAE
jgi:hypothetical protein